MMVCLHDIPKRPDPDPYVRSVTVVEKILRWTKILAKALRLHDYYIMVRFKAMEEHTEATCNLEPDYRQATLNFDRNNEDSTDLEVVRHELLHIVFDKWMIYRKAVHELVDPKMHDTLDVVFDSVQEQTIRRVETILDGLDRGPQKLLLYGENGTHVDVEEK